MQNKKIFRSDIFYLFSLDNINSDDLEIAFSKIENSGAISNTIQFQGKEMINPLTNQKDQIVSVDLDILESCGEYEYNTAVRLFLLNGLIKTTPITRSNGILTHTAEIQSKVPISILESLDGFLNFKIKNNPKAHKLRNRIKYVDRLFLCVDCKKESSFEESFRLTLEDLKLPFTQEFTPTWSHGRRYDFLINDNLLVEIDGRQHFFDEKFFKTTLGEQILTDYEKNIIAINNGFKIIRISYSEIKNSKDIILQNIDRDFDILKFGKEYALIE